MKRHLRIAFVMLALWALPGIVRADGLPDAVAFHDRQYPVTWISRGAASEMKDFLSGLGFVVMNAKSSEEWMRRAIKDGAKGTLFVMCNDNIPRELVGKTPTEPALIRKYLEAGGSVIWIGDTPFYYVGSPNGKQEKWDYLGGRGVLGIDTVGNWQGKSEATPGRLGGEWGLRSTWISMRALPPKTVTNVLAVDKDNNAAGWTKQFSKDSLGFIRMWDGQISSFDDTMEEDLFRIANRVLPRLAARPREGDIYLFKPSDYRPLTRIEGTGVVREALVTAFDNAPAADTKFELRIMKSGKVLKTIPMFEGARAFMKKNIAVPLLDPDEELVLISKSGGVEQELKRAQLKEPSAFFDADYAATPRINPVDIGHALVPAQTLLVTPAQSLRVTLRGVFPGNNAAREFTVHARAFDANGKEYFHVTAPGAASDSKMVSVVLNAPMKALPGGKYSLETTAADANGKSLFSEKKILHVEGGRQAKRDFGAFYTSLKYDGPVPIYDRKKEAWSTQTWDSLWTKGPYEDIVVAFPNGARFVFWRGSSNVPFWASWDNVGLTYEWMEAAAERNGLVDCVEPLQDKRCVYSRPHIVSSTPARAAVNWRYAEIDLDYTIADDEWAEEDYVFYPDGFGVRKVEGHIVPNTWHEANEMILLIPSGINPFDVFPAGAVKVLSLDGAKSQTISWPAPKADWPAGDPAVFRMNWSRRDASTPIMASWKFNKFIQLYDGWKVDNRYISPSYWGVHYPVTRGYPTTKSEPPGWRDKPGHASLLTVDTEPFSTRTVSADHQRVVWAWLIGNTDLPDAEVIAAAKSWTNPVEISAAGATGGKFDPFQRGYELRSNGAPEITVKFKGAGKGSVFNPVFIITDFAGADATVTVDGKPAAKIRAGTERPYAANVFVVWVGQSVKDDATVKIQKK